jgi:1-aminocyclopropane-1-carboxylate deaminase/D-cysteine desulfhydrase-like pyridoxal-dependent ACC family enzyme
MIQVVWVYDTIVPYNSDIVSRQAPIMHTFFHSPVTEHYFEGRYFYLKRDDLLHPQFSGNKARKLMTLLESPLPQIKTLISYGSPQANSLYSFAALAALRNWQFEFYVDHIPSWLEKHPLGNYRAALALGAKIYQTRTSAAACHPQTFIQQVRHPEPHCLVIPEGGRSELAKPGIMALGQEILTWFQHHHISHPVVALPSGTGTTSLYLHQYLSSFGIQVLTCACVGGPDYLRQQWDVLGANSYPTILSLPHKHHFGKLYREHYTLWQQLLAETRVEFELLYDPLMWRCLRPWLAVHEDATLLYVHQGGLQGNESMLPRYRRKYPQLSASPFRAS